MATQNPDWVHYAATVHKWIQEAYARVYDAQDQMSDDQSKVGCAALSCLLAAHDYMEIAFLAFQKNLFHPGLACLRPVLEMGISFLWCTFSVEDYAERLKRWMRKTVDGPKRRFRETEPFVPSSHREFFSSLRQEWEKDHASIFENLPGNLPLILNMLKEIDARQGGEPSVEGLYPMLYRMLCESAHGLFAPDRHFTPSGSPIDRRPHAPMPWDTPWASLTAIIWLVVPIYKFFGWDYSTFSREYEELLQSKGQP